MTSLLTRPQYERHLRRATRLYAQEYRLTSWHGGQFTVRNPRGKEYVVDLERGSCDCDSFIQPCKHEVGIAQLLCDTLDEARETIRNLRAALDRIGGEK